jgi:hypothetical protein
MRSIRDVATSPIAIVATPTSITRRGPRRSLRWPPTTPSRLARPAVIAKIADAPAWLAPNCAAIGLKNAPKLKKTPNTVKQVKNPTPAISHACGESRNGSFS